MSIDLDWSALDANLTSSAITFFTNAFQSVTRPNFIGEIKVTNFSFGDKEPTIEVLDVRDIYKEFLEVQNEEDEFELNRNNQQQQQQQQEEREQEFNQNNNNNNSILPTIYTTTTNHSHSNSQQSNLPFLNHSILNSRPSSSLFSPGLNNSFLPSTTTTNTSTTNTPNQSLKDFPLHHNYRSSNHQQHHPSSSRNYQNNNKQQQQNPPPSNQSQPSRLPSSSPSSLSPNHQPNSSSSSYTSSPSLQIHLKVTYKGNLHIGLSTSLIINYPNENFMNLPLNLNLTSLAFEGVILIAFEGGDKRRIHCCFLDPKDEDGIGGDSSSSSNSFGLGGGGGGGGETAGARLLSGAVVESEVGQNEKHVLKNVGKVEKFVLDVARSTLESEMVFPNFQTILF